MEQNELIFSRDDLNQETLEVLKEYEMIMYDVTTGERYTHDLLFYTN